MPSAAEILAKVLASPCPVCGAALSPQTARQVDRGTVTCQHGHEVTLESIYFSGNWMGPDPDHVAEAKPC